MQQGAPQGFPQGGPPSGFGPGGPRGGGGFIRLFMFGGPWVMVLMGLTLVVLAIAFYQVYKKAGFNGLLGLLMLIPVVNLGMMLWFAFSEWPLVKQLREAQALASLRAEGVVLTPAVAEAATTPASAEVVANETVAQAPPAPAPTAEA